MGYFKNIDVFSYVEEPDRKEHRLLSSKLVTLTVREYAIVLVGLSVSLIVNVGLIFWIAGLYSV